MSTGNSGSGGVRNLRAIFENKANDPSTSPPSRGRSPSGSVSSVSSRPLSKVRTNFISVERIGEAGRRKSTMDSTNDSGLPGLGSILKGSPFEPQDYERSKYQEKPSHQPGTSKEDASQPKSNGVADRAAAMARKIQEGGSKPSTTKLETKNTAPSARTTASKIASPTQAKKSPITPTGSGPTVKPRGGVAKIQGVTKSAQEAAEAREATAAAGKPQPAAKDESALEKTTAAKTTRPPRQSLRPRSPTRSTRLPSAATAPTAASKAKLDSDQAPEAKPAEKKPLVRGPPRVANATTASSQAKKAPRSSLGPNTTATERPKSRVSGVRPPADEGFLARMMRPTASSAQKTHSKTEVASPPRPRKTSAGQKDATVKRVPRRSLATTDKALDENKENEGEAGAEDVEAVENGIDHEATDLASNAERADVVGDSASITAAEYPEPEQAPQEEGVAATSS